VFKVTNVIAESVLDPIIWEEVDVEYLDCELLRIQQHVKRIVSWLWVNREDKSLNRRPKTILIRSLAVEEIKLLIRR
jgi:hypothetical protein